MYVYIYILKMLNIKNEKYDIKNYLCDSDLDLVSVYLKVDDQWIKNIFVT